MTPKNPHAVITGGGSGIGRAIAKKLAHEGFIVSILDLSEDRSQAVAEEIISEKGKAIGIACDLSTRNGAHMGVKKAREKFGPIETLINNVGIYPSAPFMETTDEDWDKIMAICLKSCFWCCQECLTDMIGNQSGHIVNMASIDGITPGPGNAVYSAAKSAVISITRSVAMEMIEHNINVNAVAPGWVETPNIMKGDRWKEVIRKIPIQRLAKPEEIADVVSFLVSEKSKYITGEVINVNGGLLMN